MEAPLDLLLIIFLPKKYDSKFKIGVMWVTTAMTLDHIFYFMGTLLLGDDLLDFFSIALHFLSLL